jgi:hypothetical protein
MLALNVLYTFLFYIGFITRLVCRFSTRCSNLYSSITFCIVTCYFLNAFNLLITSAMDSASGLPPFPKTVPTLPLLRVSLKKLLDHDEKEVKRLINACEDNGFLYLDLRDATSYSTILDDAERLFATGDKFFALSYEEKKKYDFSATTPYFGYKKQGSSVVDRTGIRDRNESYNVLYPVSFLSLL